ncbi:MAG: DNA polymerase III subunit alpha [Elusimicrobia bacterium CG_4_10_14_0_2_um_filter_56_8]|nr:MAG: DNA polymerase III subunit alpha [Elusimicrobia bacterium CG_4_10_14_0_2_um_filter_56_8]
MVSLASGDFISILMQPSFIHLHNHSEYSLLDGMLRISDGHGNPSDFLKGLAARPGNALAITDHGNMYGAMEFYFLARAVGLKPIVGCECYVTRGSRKDRDKSHGRRENGHMTVLARNEAGYKNLIKMVSSAYLEGFYHDPRIDAELLAKHSEGLVCLSGCLKSHIARGCAEGRLDEAAKMAMEYQDILGKGNFYLELMDHGIPEEMAAMAGLIEVSKRTGIPLVATNDCHYLKKEDWEAHDAHVCISTGSTLDDPDRMRHTQHELYYKSPEEMIKLFSHTPEAIKNTLAIAEMCDLKVETGKLYLPAFDVPSEFKVKNPEEPDFYYLKELCEAGLKLKVPNAGEDYRKRLEFELDVIRRMGFASYFLIVMDFINHGRSIGVPVGPGRGSGAGSLVAYTLDITRVDPLPNGLLFERFLNPGRKSMPDLDIDFSDDGREKVVQYVREKYGAARVANIITYGTIKAKSAVRDVGRVMNIPLSEINAIAKLVPSDPKATLYKALNEVNELKEYARDPKIKKMFDIALKVEGLRRHTGVHAAGVVISKDEITDQVPLSNRNTKEIITTQYDGSMLGSLGMLKVDFLGLRTLSVIETASEFLRAAGNKDFDIYSIPMDDKKTFELLCEGKTTGVFQLESDGMKNLVKGLKPTVFSDIAALVALYRPGPINSGMLETFVERKHGRKKITYDHPLLEPILKDTYGTMVYQEQVMEIAKSLAKFTPSEADDFRKAMGKKKLDVMEKMRSKFVDQAKSMNDIPNKLSTKIFDQMAQFAEYGFNKSHSVAYALVAYQTAWLKVNHPVEFMAALLTSEIGHSPIGSEDKENKLVTYIGEAQDMDIGIQGPSVNRSYKKFSIEDIQGRPAIRFALTAVKNVGAGVVEGLVAERDKNGPFRSFEEFTLRADTKQLNKRVVESLAKGGAFDVFYPAEKPGISRTKAMAAVEAFCGGKGFHDCNQAMLFGEEKKAPAVMSEHALLKNEREVLGFYFSGHPLNSYRRHLAMVANAQAEKVLAGEFAEGAMVRVAGIVAQFKSMQTKKTGEAMAKFEVEDLTGNLGVCLFPKKYKIYGSQLGPNKIVVVTGKVQKSDFGAQNYELIAEEAYSLFDAMNKWARGLVLNLPEGILFDEKQLHELKSALGKSHGMCPVYFQVNAKGRGVYMIETTERITLTDALLHDIERLLGDKTWKVESGF